MKDAIQHRILIAALGCAALAFVSIAHAQTQQPAPVPDRSAAPPPAAASQPSGPAADRDANAADAAADEDALTIFRAPLLREGSHLVLAKATAIRDAKSGEWRLLIERTDSGAAPAAAGDNEATAPNAANGAPPRYEMTLLPCARLAEMQRIIESSPDHRVTFQVSGQVLVFRGRNYLLPTYTPVLGEEILVTVATTSPQTQPASAPRSPANPTATATSTTTTNPATTSPASTPPADRSAQDISRDLEKAAGPLRKSGGAASSPSGGASGSSSGSASGGSASPAGTESDSNPEQSPEAHPDASSSAARLSTRGAERRAAAAASGHPEKLIREGTILTARRGKLSRDGAGGWNFVFDADASGLADPPVRLLPCLLLERIEDYARHIGNNSPALLSGPVYLYNGRNYLMPTVFRIPQDRRNITP